MEVIIIVLAFIGINIYTYFSKKAYVKNKVRKSWGKFPQPRIIDDLDEKELNKSMEVIRKYYPKDFYIDSYTWEDLDFIKIFRKINKGYSSVGQDYLFYRLRNYGKDSADLESFQALKDFFEKNPKIREQAEANLYYMGKNDNFSVPDFIDTRISRKNKNNKFIYFLGSLPLIFLIVSIVSFQVYPRLGVYGAFAFILFGLINIGYYRAKSKYKLADIKNSAYLGNFLKRSKKFTTMNLPNSEKIKTKLKELGKISFWMNFVAVENTDDPLLLMGEELKKMFLLPLIAYDQVDKLLDHKHMEALALFLQVGKIEAAISTLNYELALGATNKPDFIEEYEILGSEVCHPLLDDPVANDVDFTGVNIITGSNASGKSTYVKSIAINAIFAQTLNFVYAKSFKLKKAGVFTSMAIKDDVVSGDSYFIAEIKSLKRIVDDVENNKSYYFIDEILKGTNTIERIGASSSIISYLLGKNALAMIASHDIELVSMFGDSVRNIHFREYVKENGDIDFDYKLKEGPSKTRNAIKLLENLGFAKEIVDLAKSRASALTKEKEI